MFVVHHDLEEKPKMEFGFTKVDYTILIQETMSLLLLILSPRIRQDSQRGRSWMQRSQDLCTQAQLSILEGF
jgi:hypothetical protein